MKNNTKTLRPVYIDRLTAKNLIGEVRDATDELINNGAEIVTQIRTIAPIQYDIVVVKSAGLIGTILVSDGDQGITPERLLGAEGMRFLPDASLILGKQKLMDELSPKIIEITNLENFRETLLKVYNNLQMIGFNGAQSERINTNKISYVFEGDKIRLTNVDGLVSVNNRGQSVEARIIPSVFDTGYEYVREIIVTPNNNMRTIRDLALVVAFSDKKDFYTRPMVDFTPLKRIIGIESEWDAEDVDILMPSLNKSIAIPRTSSDMLARLIRKTFSAENKGVYTYTQKFIKALNESFGFNMKFRGRIFQGSRPYELLEGKMEIGDRTIDLGSIILPQVLAMNISPDAVRDYESGEALGFASFLTEVGNPTISITGISEKYMFSDEFIIELERAVNKTIKLVGFKNNARRRSNYYAENVQRPKSIRPMRRRFI